MYTEGFLGGTVMPVGTGPLAEEDLDAGAAVHGEYVVLRRCRIRRLYFYVTEAVVATSVAPVVTFRQRLAYAVTGSQVSLGTLTIPDTTAVGKVLYKNITPVVLNVGDTLCLDNTTAGTGGSTAGKGIYGFELEDEPEQPANETDMVASA
jgi:hypothetical protein